MQLKMASDYKDHWLNFSKKVLDVRLNLGYNELIKNGIGK